MQDQRPSAPCSPFGFSQSTENLTSWRGSRKPHSPSFIFSTRSSCLTVSSRSSRYQESYSVSPKKNPDCVGRIVSACSRAEAVSAGRISVTGSSLPSLSRLYERSRSSVGSARTRRHSSRSSTSFSRDTYESWHSSRPRYRPSLALPDAAGLLALARPDDRDDAYAIAHAAGAGPLVVGEQGLRGRQRGRVALRLGP